MHRFNLTFKGEILPGHKAEQVKLRFGEMFAVDDPVQLDRFFSGQPVILRRNLDRKTAAEYFQKLHQLGMAAELVKTTTADTVAAIVKTSPPSRKTEIAARNKVLREAAERKAAEEVARRQTELAEKKREATARATAPRTALEEQTTQRAAVELAQRPALKLTRASVKTNLEVPLVTHNNDIQTATTFRPRQPGEPNLYSLHPFRNTPEVRARAKQSQSHKRARFIAAALALVLAALLLLGGRFLNLPMLSAITGARAMAVDAQARLVLLAGDSLLLHDRSGVGTGTLPLEFLGLAALQAPMAFNTTGELLALGRLLDTDAQKAGVESLQLLRCNLTEPLCHPFSAELENSSIDSFVIHTLDGAVFLADAVNGQLLKSSADGTVLARTKTAIPDNPVLRLESGLLFMNSALGPAISVFRYDESAFGQQLDEILLLPPAASEAKQLRVGDFVWSADNWWASMFNPQTRSVGLYRFDTQWNFIGQAELPADTWPQQLATWGEKTLVRDAHQVPLQRFNAGGTLEVPLVSELLESLVARHQRNANLAGLAWRASLILCVLVAIASLCLGSLARLRSLVYKHERPHGSDPVGDHADAIHWVDPATDRRGRLRRITIGYAVITIALLLFAIARQVTAMQLAAALLALSGPAVALLLLSRCSKGHIGILQKRLLLVDHSGMYHIGDGPRMQYRGPFLLLDDVVVFTGARLLPAFSSKQIADEVTPLVQAGVEVDRKTVIVKLLQGRHPLIQGAAAMLVAFSAAAMLFCLRGIF